MGQAGLGYSFDSLQENSSNEFAHALKGLLTLVCSSFFHVHRG